MKLVRLISVVLILMLSALSCQIPGMSSAQATEAPVSQETAYPPASSLPTSFPEPHLTLLLQAALEQALALYQTCRMGRRSPGSRRWEP